MDKGSIVIKLERSLCLFSVFVFTTADVGLDKSFCMLGLRQKRCGTGSLIYLFSLYIYIYTAFFLAFNI